MWCHRMYHILALSQDRWQDFQRAVIQDAQETSQARVTPSQGPHQANGDLDRVQGMFPHDTLHLYDENPLAMVR